MAISTGQVRFNTGRDLTMVLVGPFGQVQIDNVTDFESKQDYADVKVDRLDGKQGFAALPKGWTGSFSAERAGPALDQLFDAIEAAWVNGGSYLASAIFTYITEPDGSTYTEQYDGVALKFSDAGSWKSDSTVKQKVEFMASRRRSI